MSLLRGNNDTWIWVIILFIILVCSCNDQNGNNCCADECGCNQGNKYDCECHKECNCCLR
ncbi:MAG: hypothetical protein E7419_06285 [Ruminococcaceae bacterium]|nr:hypothetical protein [Oscillospiraceae bacterium]